MSGMDLRLSEEQVALSEVLTDLLARHGGSAAVRAAVVTERGFDEDLWSRLCSQVGVSGLAIPESFGGAGCGFVDQAVALERLGYSLAPSPLLATTVAVAALIQSGGDSVLLQRIAEGASATVAWAGADGIAGTPLLLDADAVSGTVQRVVDGDSADVLLAAAVTVDRTVLVEVLDEDAGECLVREPTPTVDQALRLARVTCTRVPVRVLGEIDLEMLLDTACAAVAAMQVGVASRGLDMTVSYSQQRQQFGRPIGSFQALKHRMADMLVQVETARSAALHAAFAVDDGRDLSRRAAAAKAWCGEACRHVAAESVQLHGGIAITWEHDAHLVFKRAHALAELFGAAPRHRARLLES